MIVALGISQKKTAPLNLQDACSWGSSLLFRMRGYCWRKHHTRPKGKELG